MNRRLVACAALILLAVVPGCAAPGTPGLPGTGKEPATYYVAAGGDDSASGRTPDEAWGSLRRVTEQDLAPGETVVLDGDAPLRGTLRVTSDDAGDPDLPVRITATATFPGILAEGQAGVDIVDTSGVEVTDLSIRPADPDATTNGVLVTVSPGTGRQSAITLRALRIDATFQGIAVGVERPGDRISDVSIDGVHVTGAVRNGILTYGPTAPDHGVENLRISNSTVTGTRGVADADTNTGSGIIAGSVTGAVLEGNVASHNGAESDAPEGPIGIWTHDATDVILRDNVSHHNRTRWTDGGGFGVDISSTRVLVERNLSHDNDGAGFLVYTRGGAHPTGNVTVRYNASVRDGVHDHFPSSFAILGGLDDTDPEVYVHDIHVHHNTIITSPNPGGSALLLMGTVDNARFHHNILDARAAGTPALRTSSLRLQGDVTFTGNQLMTPGVLLDLAGHPATAPEDLQEVFGTVTDNTVEWADFRDPGDLPRGLAVVDPVRLPGAGVEDTADLLGQPVGGDNPVPGAVSRG